MFVAVDIGCIECGEASAVLGIFHTKKRAEAVCAEHRARQAENRKGQHSFEVFEVSQIGQVCKVGY